jgi:hypothetical protein
MRLAWPPQARGTDPFIYIVAGEREREREKAAREKDIAQRTHKEGVRTARFLFAFFT